MSSIVNSLVSLFLPNAAKIEAAPVVDHKIATLERELEERHAACTIIEARLADLEHRAESAALASDRNAIRDLEIEIATDRRLFAVANKFAAEARVRLEHAKEARARARAEAEHAAEQAKRASLDATLTPEALHAELAPIRAKIVAARNALLGACAEHDEALAEYERRYAERANLGGDVPERIDPKVMTLHLAFAASEGDPEILHRILDDGRGSSWVSVTHKGLSTAGTGENANRPLRDVVDAIGFGWLRGVSRGTHPSSIRAAALRQVVEATRSARTLEDVKIVASEILDASGKAENEARAAVQASVQRERSEIAAAAARVELEDADTDDDPLPINPNNLWNGFVG